MAKEQTAGQITSRELNRLIGQIEDKSLREQLLKAVSRLDVDKKYGLRFERHIPEVVTEDGKTISLGGIYFPWLRLMGSEAGEQEFKPVQGKSPKGPDHILIEADNYIALKYMQYTHSGQIDVIYIDPPYNTGAVDWKYNNDYVDSEDQFRHSKWLSFMEKRLKLAKKLLKADGVLLIAIDDYEIHSLGMLCKEIFPQAKIQTLIHKNYVSGKGGRYWNMQHEYVISVSLGAINRQMQGVVRKSRSAIRNGSHDRREDRPSMFYPVFWDEETGAYKVGASISEKVTVKPQEAGFSHCFLPIDSKGNEKVWEFGREGMEERLRLGSVQITKKGILWYYESKLVKEPNSVLDERAADGAEGSKTLGRLFGKNKPFNYPKSPAAVRYFVEKLTWNKRSAIVLDFFAGSGTTFQAVAELNEADGGTRQCILVTNNESNICRDVTWERMKRVTKGTHDYPECTTKYDGCPSAQIAFYKMEVYDQNDIQGKLRGWKQRMDGYLPLLSFKEKLSHEWERIPRTKGFFQKDIAVVNGAETDYDTVGFLRDKKISTLWIVCDDREEFRMIKGRLPSTIRHCYQLPRGYRDHFEAFFRDEE
jgi:adenine-specific DNA-methyltransferase